MAVTLASRCAAEALGTFLLVFTVGCNVLTGNAVWGGVSIASVLMVAIYALGGISGANFNPAVSLSLGLIKAMQGPTGAGLDWADVGIYMAVQTVAGIAAAFCYYGLFGQAFSLGPAPGFGAIQAGLCEVLYTFMLCFVVLNVAATKKRDVKGNQYYGLAIGFVIVAGAYGAGAVSGGCFNPAVALGIGASSFARGGALWLALYPLCEFAGASLAAALFRVVRPDEFDGAKTPVADLVSEFLGTFMLVLTVGLNVLGKSPAGAFSIAASLMCMIYALGDVSGAHFNPAVTVAIFLSGRCKELDVATMGKYIGVQLLGGLLAAGVYSGIHGGGSFALKAGTGFGWPSVFIAEAVFTFVLCFIVLGAAVSRTTKSTTMFGLAIGACVTVGGNAIGAISGGCLNPAVACGIALSHSVTGGAMAFLAYTCFELVGAVAAAAVFTITHKVDTSSLAKKEGDDEGQSCA